MATRTVVLDRGSGPDWRDVGAAIYISRVIRGAAGDTLVYPTPQRVPITNPPTGIDLEIGQAYTFDTRVPGEAPITALIAGGDGPLLLKDLEPVDPSTLEPEADPGPAWFEALDALNATTEAIALDAAARGASQAIDDADIPGQLTNTANNLVADMPGVAAAAAALAQSDAGLIRSDPLYAQAISFAIVDEQDQTFDAEFDLRGHISERVMQLWRARLQALGLAGGDSVYNPSRSFALVDSAGQATDIELDARGHITDRVVALWASRLGVIGGGGAPSLRPSWASAAHPFDPTLAAYNVRPDNMARWTAAFARATAGLGVARASVLGTSISYGAAATGASQPKHLNSWPGRLRRMLDAYTAYASGTGIAVPWNTIYPETPADDPRWSFASGVAQLAGAATAAPNAGPVGRGMVQLAGSSQWAQFTPGTSGVGFTIYASADSGASGVADVLVDGSSVGTFSVAAAASGGTLARRAGTPSGVIVVDVPATAGVHVVRVVAPSGSSVSIWGIKSRTGKGVEVSNLARSSTSATSIALDDTTDHRYGLPMHVDAEPAQLVIIEHGMNDRSRTSAAFKADMRVAIERARTAGGNVLLLVAPQPDYTNGSVGASSMIPRATDLYALADEYDLPLLDLAWAWVDFTTANALGKYADSIHPGDLGLELFARALFNLLTKVA